MKLKSTIFLSVVILLLASGCTFIPSIKGNGQLTTHTIDINDYDRIELQVPSVLFNYSQEPESAPALTVTVDENIYDIFSFTTQENTLVVTLKDPNMKKRIRPTQFLITSNSTSLKKVSMAGFGEFNVTSRLASGDKIKLAAAGNITINLRDSVFTDELSMDIAGGATLNAKALSCRLFKGNMAGKGTLHLGGAGEKARVDVAGKAQVHAFDFELSEISCSIAGMGKIETQAKARIKADIAGIGHIYYKGDPSIEIKKAGLGNVKKVD